MIVARFEDSRLKASFHQLETRCDNLSAPLRACGQIVLSSVDKNFMVQGRYAAAGDLRGGNNRWQPLAASTVLSRIGGSKAFTQKGSLRKPAQRKIASMRILQRRGTLATSFTAHVSGNTLIIGSNLVYAAIHNYGGMAGRGKKVSIPARPMLVIQDDDVEEMILMIRNFLFK